MVQSSIFSSGRNATQRSGASLSIRPHLWEDAERVSAARVYPLADYGFKPTDEWAHHVMLSSVRFNSGGSASFVSSTGLVLTNHHVAADTLQKVSTPQIDEGQPQRDVQRNASQAAAGLAPVKTTEVRQREDRFFMGETDDVMIREASVGRKPRRCRVPQV